MLKKSVSMLMIALFVFSFITVAGVAAGENQKISGQVMSVNPENGEVMIKDDAGEMKSLTAGPDVNLVDLKSLQTGDQISVVSDSEGVIKSLAVSK